MNGDSLLGHFSWLTFAVLAAIYSFVVFTCYGFRSGTALSRRNIIPPSTILLTHLYFLIGLLALAWTAAAIYPRLPNWATAEWFHAHGSHSDFDIVIIGLIACMLFWEHKRIYREAETGAEESQ
jgi:hypothetical protein